MAIKLAGALSGQRVRVFRSALAKLADAQLEGVVVAGVRARGKHLLIDFDDGRILHSHLRMRGRWRVLPRGDAWQRFERRASALIVTDRASVVGMNLPVLALLRRESEAKVLVDLGPDLLDPEASLDEMVTRLQGARTLPIGVALMRQRLVAGIGNVYKSELLFLEKLSPFVHVAEVEAVALRGLLERARALMRRNTLSRGPRITRKRQGGRVWVYRRAGERCLVCDAIIEMRRQGEELRSTYYCPECQSTTSPGSQPTG